MTLEDQRVHHDTVDPHTRGRWLGDLVLGAQDGVVNTLGVVLGVVAATDDSRVVVATGLAAAAAESISMAAVAYTSASARGELFRAERAREQRHVETTPEVEREEIRRLFEAKGFRGALLDDVVKTICANKDIWVRIMMAEEHALVDVDRRAALGGAFTVGASSIAGAVVPVLPFLCPPSVLSRSGTTVLSVLTGAVVLFALGAFKARVTLGRPARSGLALAAIGLLAAGAGYGVALVVGHVL